MGSCEELKYLPPVLQDKPGFELNVASKGERCLLELQLCIVGKEIQPASHQTKSLLQGPIVQVL